MNTEIVCVNFPPLIQIELKDHYPEWYDRCIFQNNINELPSSSSLLILPAAELQKSKLPSQKYIVFGSSEFLESSYLQGCLDYLRDPWTISELIIRCSRFLTHETILVDEHEMSNSDNDFFIDNKYIKLTPAQSRILKVFFDNPGVYFDCGNLQKLLGPALISSDASLYVQIYNIRKALKEALKGSYGKSIILKNLNRRGYVLDLPVDNLCKNVDKL